LFPSNYVKLGDQHNTPIIQTPDQRFGENPQANNFKEHTRGGAEKKEGEAQYKISEPSESEHHKKDEEKSRRYGE
jgi:hypothetical protein